MFLSLTLECGSLTLECGSLMELAERFESGGLTQRRRERRGRSCSIYVCANVFACPLASRALTEIERKRGPGRERNRQKRGQGERQRGRSEIRQNQRRDGHGAERSGASHLLSGTDTQSSFSACTAAHFKRLHVCFIISCCFVISCCFIETDGLLLLQ